MTASGQIRSFGDVGSSVRFARKADTAGRFYEYPTWAGPAILSGASKAERKAAPEHISNVSYPGLCSIEQHI